MKWSSCYFCEMGAEVSEFHIAEGDRDFTKAIRPYGFPALLDSGQLDPSKNPITYHQVKIPEGVGGRRRLCATISEEASYVIT